MAQYQREQMMYIMWHGFMTEITVRESGFVPYTFLVSSSDVHS